MEFLKSLVFFAECDMSDFFCNPLVSGYFALKINDSELHAVLEVFFLCIFGLKLVLFIHHKHALLRVVEG